MPPTSPRDAPYTLPFTAISARDLPLVGGKGANLGEMAGAGFPVPPGFCVTTAAFVRFMAGDPSTEAWVYRNLDDLETDDLVRVRRVGTKVRERLIALPIPPDIKAAVVTAWEDAGTEHAYAVRSSATAEDLPGASFAGQQDTYLNVRGREALLAAVRACWVSLFTDRAIIYRATNGFDHRAVQLSVVVQRMVEPEVSGILFTADPLTGHRHIASIDAGFGLGEALVGGLVSADLYRVDSRDGRLLEARVADKQLAIRALPGGGTVRETLVEPQRSAQVLTEAQAIQLARLGKRIAAHYGSPQDIEWCIDAAGETFVVQSRPITSLYPLPEPAPPDEALHVYASFSHVQVMTDPMPPLALATLRILIPFGKRDQPEAYNPYVATAGGRVYVDATPPMLLAPVRERFPSLLAAAADSLMAGALREVVERNEFLIRGAAPGVRRTRPREIAHYIVPILLRVQAWLWWRRPESAVPMLDKRIVRITGEVEAALAAAAPGPARVREARRLLGSVFLGNMLPVVPVIAGGMLSRVILLRLTGDRAAVDALLRGFSGNVTTEMDLEVGDLADLARRHPAVAARLTENDPATALAGMAEVEGGAEFLAALDGFLDRYGMRGASEIDISRPRWSEDPSPLIQVIVGSLRAEAPGLHRAQHARQAREGEAAARRLIAASRHGILGSLRGALAHRMTRVMRGLMAGREHPKFILIRTLGLVKPVLQDAGRELAAKGRLDRADDVWFLDWDELLDALESPAAELRTRVAARRTDLARYAHLRPPRVVTSDGEIPEVRHDHTDLPAGALPGNAASAGIVEGIAHVVRDPTTEILSPGEILVAPFTDPGWTPLFINAAGLVMEVGGLMTHGSVVAREYGIPAVVGVLDATTQIHTGQRVRVNGDLGFVEIVADGAEADAGAELEAGVALEAGAEREAVAGPETPE